MSTSLSYFDELSYLFVWPSQRRSTTLRVGLSSSLEFPLANCYSHMGSSTSPAAPGLPPRKIFLLLFQREKQKMLFTMKYKSPEWIPFYGYVDNIYTTICRCIRVDRYLIQLNTITPETNFKPEKTRWHLTLLTPNLSIIELLSTVLAVPNPIQILDFGYMYSLQYIFSKNTNSFFFYNINEFKDKLMRIVVMNAFSFFKHSEVSSAW